MTENSSFLPTIRVGILVFEGFEPIDVWGPVEMFTISRFIGTSYWDPPPHPFEVLFVSNEERPAGDSGARPAPVRAWQGPAVAPDLFRDEALEAGIDLLLIPGGGGTRALLDDRRPVERAALLDWTSAPSTTGSANRWRPSSTHRRPSSRPLPTRKTRRPRAAPERFAARRRAHARRQSAPQYCKSVLVLFAEL